MRSKSPGRKRECLSTPPRIICEDLSSSSDMKCGETFHQKVREALKIFRDLFDKLYKANVLLDNNKKEKKTTILIKAAMNMKDNRQWVNTSKRLEHVDGIKVGEYFQYRAELVVIGLHRQFTSGIDYLGKDENSFATSIVVTDKYSNVIKSGGCLIYEGQGSNPNVGSPADHDQKLEGGNLALKNSMDAKKPVRVILKVYGKCDGMEEWRHNVSNKSFRYDGLYLVDKMTQERGKSGKLVFKFELNKIWDQPACDFRETETFQKKRKSRNDVVPKDVVRIDDISEGKENRPIRVMSCGEKPKPFVYKARMVYPKMNHKIQGGGCNCTNKFVGCFNCVCVDKNGVAIGYDCDKKPVYPLKKSIIYECGPSSACSPSYTNRVSQCGIQFQLEIFKTKSMGWGVRTRSFIPSGSFVCELVGEFVHHNNKNAGSNLHVAHDNYIFEMGFGKGLIDATRYGNIGRFINHSCSPNLCVKDVSVPHIMLFAVKDIPAGRELNYDYNKYFKRRNINVESNSCCCCSSECREQIYI